MTKELILIIIPLIVIFTITAPPTYALAIGNYTTLLNATTNLIKSPYLTFSNTIGYPAYTTNYYNGINAFQLIYPSSYSYGGIAWPITYNGGIIKISVVGIFSFFHVAPPADGFTIILFPSNGSGINYANGSIPLFFASSSTGVGGVISNYRTHQPPRIWLYNGTHSMALVIK